MLFVIFREGVPQFFPRPYYYYYRSSNNSYPISDLSLIVLEEDAPVAPESQLADPRVARLQDAFRDALDTATRHATTTYFYY